MFDIGVSIEVTSTDLNVSSVIADFSIINAALTSVEATSCTPIRPSVYKCTWSGVHLDLEDDVDASLLFSAADTLENVASEIVPYHFNVINEFPVVRDIYSGHTMGGVVYFGINDKIILKIEHEGNFNLKKAYMDLHEIRLTLSNYPANNCSLSDMWYCEFNVNPNVADGD